MKLKFSQHGITHLLSELSISKMVSYTAKELTVTAKNKAFGNIFIRMVRDAVKQLTLITQKKVFVNILIRMVG